MKKKNVLWRKRPGKYTGGLAGKPGFSLAAADFKMEVVEGPADASLWR
jgi:hypothetical protein